MASITNTNQNALIDDLRDVLADTEAMLKDVAADTTEQGIALRDRITANLKNAKAQLIAVEKQVAARARDAAKVTDTYVHDHPWQSIGVAAGVGFLLGLLVSRR